MSLENHHHHHHHHHTLCVCEKLMLLLFENVAPKLSTDRWGTNVQDLRHGEFNGIQANQNSILIPIVKIKLVYV